jgi:hypothetical protein
MSLFAPVEPISSVPSLCPVSLLQVLESLEGYLCQCFDAIAVMLLIHITHLQRRAMNLRRMACLVRSHSLCVCCGRDGCSCAHGLLSRPGLPPPISVRLSL